MTDPSVGPRRRSPDLAGLRARVRFARRDDLAALRRRVAELEGEVQECRRLNVRLAELTDIVQELLVPLAERDETKVREYLDRYASGL